MGAPIPGLDHEPVAPVDSEVLQSLIDMGQAVDFDDAADVFAHQARQAKITDMAARVADNQTFQAARIERLRERGAIG